MRCDDLSEWHRSGIRLHVDVESSVRKQLEGLAGGEQTTVVGEQGPQFACADVRHGAIVSVQPGERRIVEQHNVAVGGDVTVGLDVFGTRRVCGGEGCGRVLPHTGVLARRGDKTAVGEDSGVTRLLEVRVRHAPGVFVGGFGVNAEPMPLSASVSSLGMIHSLLDELSLIFGSICRYWYASNLSSGCPWWMAVKTFWIASASPWARSTAACLSPSACRIAA